MEFQVPLAESGQKLQWRKSEKERARQNMNERQSRIAGESAIETRTDTSLAREMLRPEQGEAAPGDRSDADSNQEHYCKPEQTPDGLGYGHGGPHFHHRGHRGPGGIPLWCPAGKMSCGTI